MSAPLIIEVAVNGAVDRACNPHVPLEPAEVASVALACIDAGASIVHAHAGSPVRGRSVRHPSGPYVAAFEPVLVRAPGALLYPTLPGGAPGLTMAERFAHIDELRTAGLLRLAPVDPGTLNWGRAETKGPPVSTTLYQTTFEDVDYAFAYCRGTGIGCTLSIFEPGFLQLALAHRRSGTLPTATLVKFEFSAGAQLFGLPPSRESLDAYIAMLAGTGLPWMVTLRGGDAVRSIGALAVERGGHLRVGIEDFGGERSPSNVELVREAVALGARFGRALASPEQTANLIGLG
jgi:3-keto-5-aminohexanoate cleavage enzyme